MLHRLAGQLWLLTLVFGVGCGVAQTDTPSEPIQVPASVVSLAAKPVVLMTYNVLADRIAAAERTKSLLEIIRQNQPDIIALQEVAPWFLQELLDQPWIKEAYRAPLFDGEQIAPGGQYILSKFPIQKTDWIILSGSQRRTAVMVYLDIEGKTFAVATSHMESMLEDGPIRAEQLDYIFSVVEKADNAVVLGDFNFGDGEAEESHIPASYVDLWTELHSNKPGYTWNIEVSEMARAGSFPGEPSRRIDRILLRSKSYQPGWIKIVGDKPLVAGGNVFPSDHFGLVGAISLTEAH